LKDKEELILKKDIEIFESIENIEKKEMEKGRWISVIEFPEYLVSNMGHIKETESGKILKEYIDDEGYSRVYMNLDGKIRFVRVDMIVLSSFDPKPLMREINKQIEEEILEEINGNNVLDYIDEESDRSN